ncbi:hypothetical protein [Peribacillus asahii]
MKKTASIQSMQFHTDKSHVTDDNVVDKNIDVIIYVDVDIDIYINVVY